MWLREGGRRRRRERRKRKRRRRGKNENENKEQNRVREKRENGRDSYIVASVLLGGVALRLKLTGIVRSRLETDGRLLL
jgi:hypothetical protein